MNSPAPKSRKLRARGAQPCSACSPFVSVAVEQQPPRANDAQSVCTESAYSRSSSDTEVRPVTSQSPSSPSPSVVQQPAGTTSSVASPPGNNAPDSPSADAATSKPSFSAAVASKTATVASFHAALASLAKETVVKNPAFLSLTLPFFDHMQSAFKATVNPPTVQPTSVTRVAAPSPPSSATSIAKKPTWADAAGPTHP